MSFLPEVLPGYQYDFTNELSIQEFLKYGFYKIADATLKSKEKFIKNPEVNPIDYVVVSGLEKNIVSIENSFTFSLLMEKLLRLVELMLE